MDSYFFIIPSQPGFFEFKLLKDFEAIRELNFQITTFSNFLTLYADENTFS